MKTRHAANGTNMDALNTFTKDEGRNTDQLTIDLFNAVVGVGIQAMHCVQRANSGKELRKADNLVRLARELAMIVEPVARDVKSHAGATR